MLRRRISFLIVLAAICASPLCAQSPTQTHAIAFDRGDREARELVTVLLCARAAAMARSDGALGPVDSLGRAHQCMRNNGYWIVVFADVDTSFASAHRLFAYDFRSRARLAGAVDTAGFIALERAELTAQRRGAKDYRSAQRPYIPHTFRIDGDSIEVWLVPASSVMGEERTVGGERGYVFSPDGTKLIREMDSFANYRPFVIPDSGVVSIVSSEASIPTLSEFLLANALHDKGRQVEIVTPHTVSTLASTSDGDVWIHVPKK